MFRANETFHLAQFLLRHFNEMPCDWLYPKFIEAQPLPCTATPREYPLVLGACHEGLRKLLLGDGKGHDLCTHRGHFSSLKGKVVPVHLETGL